VRVLGIAGSLRSGSHNRELLRLAAAMLPDGVELEMWEGLRDLPAFDEDDEETAPAAVARLRAAIGSADAVLLAVPEYNGSIPGALKNALDWASRPAGAGAFRGKPVAVIGASTGSFGGVWAQAEARKVLGLMGARVVGDELSVGKAQDRLAAPDEELLGRLRTTVEALAAETGEREAVAA
jgi:chromate reductase